MNTTRRSSRSRPRPAPVVAAFARALARLRAGSTMLRRPSSTHARLAPVCPMAATTRIQATPTPPQEMTKRCTIKVRQPLASGGRQVVMASWSRVPMMG